MLIQHRSSGDMGAFFIEVDNEQLAEIDFSLSPGTMVILHTEVDEKLKGKNIGLQLVNHAVEYARTNNLKIIAMCPFAKKVFERNKEMYADVVKA